MICSEHTKACVFAGALFQVTFRESGEGNRPATWLKVPSFESILPAGKVLVDDPTRLVVCTITWLMSERRHCVASLVDVHGQGVFPAQLAFYDSPLWDDLIILSQLFQLLRPHDKKFSPPLWTQAPVRERDWDATIDVLNGPMVGRRKEEMRKWMRDTVNVIHGWELNAVRAGHRVEGRGRKIEEALEYFAPFFTPYTGQYRVSPFYSVSSISWVSTDLALSV